MSESSLELKLPDEAATAALGSRLAAALPAQAAEAAFIVHLKGPLGAGKTALARGVLRALGVTGTVRSPTYTLMETYPTAAATVVHLDLYRLSAPEELEGLGLRDLLEPRHLWLVEWPELGQGVLVEADLTIELSYEGTGRACRLTAATTRAHAVVRAAS